MSRYHSHLQTALKLVDAYQGSEPFAAHLRTYFLAQHKHGSRDRRLIAQLCYAFFRLGRALPAANPEARMLTGLFLSTAEPGEWLRALRPGWEEKIGLSLEEKLKCVDADISPEAVFPWKDELSPAVYHREYAFSYFQQPHLFLRIRPGYEQLVAEKLRKAGISFEALSPSCIQLPNLTAVDRMIELDREAVVQDLHSQATGAYMDQLHVKPGARIWDCCAASGGKSIMLYDRDHTIKLMVSDVRPSILANLKKRFSRAGITRYDTRLVDLTSGPIDGPDFDGIVVDAPCTGSGTWARTPEQLSFFNPAEISVYAARQKKILTNIVSRLRSGGHLLYITCSVFRQENEELVNFACTQLGMMAEKQAVLTGYSQRADSMFVAVLKK